MIYYIDRFIRGKKMAEGARVDAETEQEAIEKARKLFEREQSYPFEICDNRNTEFKLSNS